WRCRSSTRSTVARARAAPAARRTPAARRARAGRARPRARASGLRGSVEDHRVFETASASVAPPARQSSSGRDVPEILHTGTAESRPFASRTFEPGSIREGLTNSGIHLGCRSGIVDLLDSGDLVHCRRPGHGTSDPVVTKGPTVAGRLRASWPTV